MLRTVRKPWVGLLILAVVAIVFVAVALRVAGWNGTSLGMTVLIGTIAALGAMVLIAIASIVIYALVRLLQRLVVALKGRYSEYDPMSAIPFDSNDTRDAAFRNRAKLRPISEKDKRLIAKDIDRFFSAGVEHNRGKFTGAGSIGEEDKRLIMDNIDRFFEISRKQGKKDPH